MALLIDGYNLMHAAGLLGRGVGPGGLERSRLALLNFVAESLDEREAGSTTVVFDARNAPPGLPAALVHRGLRVRFAARHQEADELIEELIQADSAPRQLTVVSSDHRLQQAARRRRAKAVDSDRWHADVTARRQRKYFAEPAESKPPAPAGPSEVEFWLGQFREDATEQSLAKEEIFPPGYGEEDEE